MTNQHAASCPHRQDDNLGCDCGVIPTVDPKDEEIDRLRRALRKLAIVSHHRLAEGGGTVLTGYSCEICEVESDGADGLTFMRHRSDCPLFPLNPQQ